MITFTHVRDPLLSAWQSAVGTVAARADGVAGRASAANPLVAATNAVVTAVGNDLENRSLTQFPLDHLKRAVADVSGDAIAGAFEASANARAAGGTTAAGAVPLDCGKKALQLAQARLAGDTARADALQQLFEKGTCDPGWLKCVDEFLVNAGIHGQGSIPYRAADSLADFVIDGVLPEKATVGIVGDWGTGGPRATEVLRQIVAHRPDVLIHLGDIYYSCTDDEARRCFEGVCAAAGMPDAVRRFTLSGNHDMYAGGKPYYELLDRIGQPASYFALRNADWQLLAMDTGYNDFSPLNVNESVTSVREGRAGGPDELAWHLDKINNAGGRLTILLSHHQLFSATGINRGPVNGELLRQFGPVLGRVELWMWGHEHSHIVFGPYVGLARGRCIGASAVPVRADSADEDPYRVAFNNAPPILPPRLSRDPTDTVYNLGYAILRLDGPSGVLEHYDHARPDEPFFTEPIGAAGPPIA